MKLFSLFAIIFGISICTYAQKSTLRFQHLTPEQGLSQGHILCMLQDNEGYIWIGTYYGLNRYNGYSIKLFSKIQEDTTSLFSDVVYSLFEDSDNNIWVGTVSGLDKFNKKTETFEHYLNWMYIHTITEDHNKNIWVATDQNGLFRIDYKTKEITSFNSVDKLHQSASHAINDLIIDTENRLWIATEGGGLSVMNTSTFEIKTYFTEDNTIGSLPSNKISALFLDSKNKIWLGHPNGVLTSYEEETDEFKTYYYLPEALQRQSVHIRDIKEDSDGNLLIATMGAGLVIFNAEKNTQQLYLHNIYDPYSISSNEAYSLLVDRTGTVFVGTYGRGISRYSPYNHKFTVHYVPTTEGDNGDINSYTSCVQNWKGELIIGSYNGFFVFDKKTWKHKHILPGTTYAYNKVLSMALAPDSSLWIGTLRGLHHYDKYLNKINTYKLLKDELDHAIYSIYFDHQNNLWVGLFVAEGLFKIPEQQWSNPSNKTLKYTRYRSSDDSNSLYGDQIWSMKEDQDNNLWIGTNIGICRYNYDSDNFTRFEITPLCKTIEFDENGNMWVATRGEGIIYYDLNTQEIKNYTSEDGLSQNFVFGVLMDKNNNLWFTSEDGLSKFNPKTEKFRNYDILDGLPNNRFDDRSEKKLPNGEFYMGTARGFMVFKPEEIVDDTSSAPVVLSKLTVSNQKVEYKYNNGDDNQLDAPIGQISEIKILPKQKDFSLEFAALHYSATHKIRYKYILEGFDEDWILTTAQNRIARYTNLDGGSYTFKVYATNGDGVWNKNPLQVNIIVYPPFHKTFVFRILAILSVLLLVFLYFKRRIKVTKNQNIKLARLVEERTKEITEKNTLLKKNAENLHNTNVLLEKKQIDIEKQKEEIAGQRDELAKINTLKDKLFSIIAHDLTNPFNTIIGFSELLLSKFNRYSDEKRLYIVSNINHAAQNAYSLLQNLLDWSRSQTGTKAYNPEVSDTKFLIQTAVNQVEGLAKSKSVQIDVEIPETHSSVYVDPNMICAVVRNLLSNALKFSHKNNAIRVKLSSFDDSFDCISIIDNGVGIPPEIQKKLFTLNSNVSQKGTSGEKGTGLGLIICKDFVETNKGKIWIESELDKGTTFHFTIPKADN